MRSGLFLPLLFLACSSSATTTDKRDIPQTALEGTIASRPFVPKSADVQYDPRLDQWFLSIRNYESSCGIGSSPGASAIVVTIGALPARNGIFQISAGDGHGAAFQVGVYGANGPRSDLRPVETGQLRIDTWSETPGTTVTGGAILSTGSSEIGGAFSAKVCPPG